jgi:RNA polymerase sigma factor (sigma-70 family)
MDKPTRHGRSRQVPTHPSLDALLAEHDGLVHAVLRQQWGGTLAYEERLQAGRIGLWQALQGYDPTRGYAFSSYAWPAIQRAIWRLVRTERRAPVPAALAPPEPVEPDAVLIAQDIRAALAGLVSQLPAAARALLGADYGLQGEPPGSLRQVGRRWGLSHEAVRLRLWAALVWLRQPARSLPLRQLLGENTAAAYARTDELAQAWLRRRGGRRGG